MAVAAPKRRSSTAPAPAPSRTSPPKKRRKASPEPSPIRIRRAKGAAAAPAPATAPVRRPPARAPQRTRTRPQPRRSTQPRLALVASRTAAGVRHLPDSGLIVRMTRGRSWIAVLGVLLVGIVALNVVTLSFAASSGKFDESITKLEQDISTTKTRVATSFSQDRVRHEAAAQGLVMPTEAEPTVIEFQPQDVKTAAERLAAAG
jgi:hypothetical protein